ncbi:MAG: threonine synthase, partial [Bacteroidia bacterium]|nr:threonine synthase [Bacteroidia bacterium]
MKYYSLNRKVVDESFKNAVIKGLAPDRGLYFPGYIAPLPKEFFDHIDKYSYPEIAFNAIRQFVTPDIPEPVLKDIIKETLS